MALIDLNGAKEYIGGTVGLDSIVQAGLITTLQSPVPVSFPGGVGVYAPLPGAGLWTVEPNNPKFSADNSGNITYTGANPRRTVLEIGLSFETTVGANAEAFSVRLTKNGAPYVNSRQGGMSQDGWTSHAVAFWTEEVTNPGDVFAAEAANLTSGADVSIAAVVFVVT